MHPADVLELPQRAAARLVELQQVTIVHLIDMIATQDQHGRLLRFPDSSQCAQRADDPLRRLATTFLEWMRVFP
jgi:hypothetical protein